MISGEMYIRELANSLGADQVLTELEDLLPYCFDGTAVLRQQPKCVVFPKTTADVVAVVRLAVMQRIPIVTRGSGTGLSGGSVPVPGCIVLCLVKMDRVLQLDEQNLTVLAEAGVITQTISDLADSVGLLYPPDPGSIRISTIGGNVAENSGGLRGLKYGVTCDYVMGLEVVLADGSIVWFGNQCVKDVAGYSIKNLFIGSEGTLGIVTKVLLKLVPKPRSKKTLLTSFDQMSDAAESVSAIIAAKIIPCTLEFLDKMTIHCVEEYGHLGLPSTAEALLLIEIDGHPTAVEEDAIRIEQIARNHRANSVTVAHSTEEATRLSAARRSAFSALARLSPTIILEDATVPRSELAKMVKFIQETGSRYRLRIAIFGHMGDGNLHPTFLTNERDIAEMERVEQAMQDIFDYAVKLGGTITGEHGVGLAKKKYLRGAISGESIELMRKLKRTLDPNGILNPGKIFDM